MRRWGLSDVIFTCSWMNLGYWLWYSRDRSCAISCKNVNDNSYNDEIFGRDPEIIIAFIIVNEHSHSYWWYRSRFLHWLSATTSSTGKPRDTLCLFSSLLNFSDTFLRILADLSDAHLIIIISIIFYAASVESGDNFLIM